MMKRLFLFCTVVVLFSCSDDATTPESLYTTEGYLVSSINEATTGYTYYASYFKDQPGATAIDMTQQSTYNSLFISKRYNEFMYGNSLTGDMMLAKMAVSKEGKLVEVSRFPLLSYLSNVLIINEELGAYVLWGGTPTLSLFNPKTMEKLGDIDMSKATKIAANERNYYRTMVYRPQDNRLFLALVTDSDKTGQFYDATDTYVEVVNMTTQSWEKTTVFKGAMDPVAGGNENQMIDELGNIYFMTQGSLGLNGQMGPASAAYSRPQVLKIPAGSTDFDASYSFNPVNVFGQTNLLVQLMLGGIYDANGIAYTCISAASESPRILELVQKLAAGTITEQEYYELRLSVFYSQNQRWVKIDLNAQTVTAINDIPMTAGYSYPYAYKYDGKFYMQFNATGDKTSGYYEYDPSTGKAQKAVNITQGGMAVAFIKLNAQN
jgi:hypothetical protein